MVSIFNRSTQGDGASVSRGMGRDLRQVRSFNPTSSCILTHSVFAVELHELRVRSDELVRNCLAGDLSFDIRIKEADEFGSVCKLAELCSGLAKHGIVSTVKSSGSLRGYNSGESLEDFVLDDLLFLGTDKSVSPRASDLFLEGLDITETLPRAKFVGNVVVVQVNLGFDFGHVAGISHDTVDNLRLARDVKCVRTSEFLTSKFRLGHFADRSLREDTTVSNVGGNKLYLLVVRKSISRGRSSTVDCHNSFFLRHAIHEKSVRNA